MVFYKRYNAYIYIYSIVISINVNHDNCRLFSIISYDESDDPIPVID